MARRVFISVDMEGVDGVVSPDQATPGRRNYEFARRLMIREANAAVRGAYRGGATEVLVNDSHDGMLNLKREDIDGRAELISGSHKKYSMMEGLDDSFSCALFVGYHSMASGGGVLSHTMSGHLSKVRVNNYPGSEGVLNAMLAGSMNVPVTLVCGDELAVGEVLAACPAARKVIVKNSIDRFAARNSGFADVERAVEEEASLAVAGATNTEPFRPRPPIEVEIEFAQPSIARRANLSGLLEFRPPSSVIIRADNGHDAWVAFRGAISLAATARDPDYG